MIISRKVLVELVRELKSGGNRIVFTNGCFDIVHSGHVKYLAESRKLGDVLIVGLNTDDSVHRLKGPSRPINSTGDRATVLNAIRSVDIITFFDEDTPEELIHAIAPDVLVKGGDYTFDTIVGANFVSSYGGTVATIPLVEGKSTTSIICKAGEL
jgi:glycerol-3-phosphate cytidylyltransferase